MDWSRISRFPSKELRKLQEHRLRIFLTQQLVLSRFYRERLQREKIDPRTIRTLEDLARLPFTCKADLLPTEESPERPLDFVLRPDPQSLRRYWPRRRLLRLLSRGRQGAVRYLEREYRPNFLTFTTGRSASPVAFLYTPHDLRNLHETGARIMDVAALSREDRSINLFPFAPHLAFWQTTFGGFASGALVLGTGGGRVMGTMGSLRAIDRLKATVLIGVPGFVYHCLRRALETGVRMPHVHTVILGAEKLPENLRARMRETLSSLGAGRVRILGTYGFTEARMAWTECPAENGESTGYHLYPDLGIFEVIDPETGEVRGPGEPGEIVFTPLDGRGSCVLRYRTGDLSETGIEEGPCRHCGRLVPRLGTAISRVSNRTQLELVKLKGTLVSLDDFGAVLGSLPDVEEWQVEISKAGNDPFGLDELSVFIALHDGADPCVAAERVRKAMRDATEVTPNRVEVLPLPDLLDRLGMETEMKEKRFLDRRPKS